MTTQTAAPADAVPQPLVVRTVPLDDLGRPGPSGAPDAADLLDLLPSTAPLAWVRRGDGLVAWGETLRVEVRGADRFARAEEAWRAVLAHAVVRDEVRLPGTGAVAFASFAFDEDSPAGGVVVVPRVVVGRRGDRVWLTTITAGRIGAAPALADVVGPRVPPVAPGDVAYRDGAVAADDWRDVVAAGVAAIRAGEVDKVVLARDVHARTQHPVDVRWALHRLTQRYPSCWTFSVDGLIGATPELLVRSEKGLVTSRVLAGTIRRTGDDAADMARAAILAHSSKDLEEHEYAVSSVAHALEPFCSSTNVPDVPFVLHLPNVLHLASDVTGVLTAPAGDAAHPSSLALAAALHPTAAVCGTPTSAARALIARVEGMDRGRYAGPVGWMGADGDGEWGIALRSAQVDAADPRSVRLFAGCGIVAASDPAAELAESEAKLVPMRDALGHDPA
ncbi:isochorismate synthase [Cellulomonas fimi]|uniref:isochorismate synthase n=1 Tax=Cellulomonas fimi (strain ATCC 484 / DSM 20113 / JCM 1341 / CCUG 24087 / LMG 16345 / NBRC 15513 / NCIMB 8980 / NCTC 7547 / NRS-133) TaxID=590998 RepID=F4H196_CELFA|nr:isochorismate synthase [Cellulomonas fimi]AEE45067.1 isochorismate synthase [Cellulomonas fimi ATCC 484]NNH08757.1 isochorismate synthase [Cellulomonas fimi]VEH28139.1 Isochorismate synthase dhbC [Cellulomonas fimi]